MNKGRKKLPKQKLKGKKILRGKCVRCGTELPLLKEADYCVSCAKTKSQWSGELTNVWRPETQ